MRVALVRPPNIGSHARGIGFYTDRLCNSLQKIQTDVTLVDLSFSPTAYKNFDVVHFPYFDLFYLTFPPVRSYKTVVTLHDVIPLKYSEGYPLGLRGKVVWPIQRQLLSSAAAVITDSLASAADIENIAAVKKSRIYPVLLAADEIFRPLSKHEIISKVAEKYRLPKTFILYVGGVNWNKNLPVLVRACLKINIPLVIVGREALGENLDLSHAESGPFREVLKLIAGTDLVKRLGFVAIEDLVAIYNLASVYVQPSIYEGFGLPILEAMACGTPVICGHNSSLPEIAGDAATYANVTDPNDLAEKIKNVKPTGKEIAQAKKCSWEKTAQKTFTVYKNLLNQ